MRTRLLCIPSAAAAALVLTTPAFGGPAAVSPLTIASGPSPFAACAAGGPGTNYQDAELEPFVAVNPTNPANVIGVFQQDRWSNGGAHGLATVASTNGGATWTETFPHFSTCAGGTPANGGSYDRASDPWVSIGPDGTAYQVSLSTSADLVTSAILASVSADGGLTWSEPATIKRDVSTDNFVFNDKESVTADPYRAGTAYVVWDRSRFPSDNANPNAGHAFSFRSDTWFARTTDDGATWSAPREILPLNQNVFTIGNQIVVLPNRTLVDVFHFGKGSGIDAPNASFTGVMRSTDGGQTWSRPITVSNNPAVPVIDPETGRPLRTGSDIGGGIPDIGVDPRNGKLYTVWEDSRFSGTHNDVAMSTSSDGGLTWTAPVRVNQSPAGITAFTPVVDVLADGTVGVTYYDWRNNTAAPGLLVDEFLVHSHDGGATWSEARVTPASFDEETAPFARGYFLGDYEGLAHNATSFLTFFALANSGNLANRTDIAFATAAP